MTANINDKFLKVGTEGTLTSLEAPGKALGASSINVGSTANWPSDTAVSFSIRRYEIVDGKKKTVDGTYTSWKGVVSGTTITNLALKSGVDQVYSADGVTEVFINVTAEQHNSMVDGILVAHKQDGSHKPATIDVAALASAVRDLMFRPGMVSAYGGDAAPAGWLLCDGAAVSRATYADLFAAIGTAYGAGNGTTTFNLPNAKGRVLVGLDASQTEFDTLGKSVGSLSHQHPLSNSAQAKISQGSTLSVMHNVPTDPWSYTLANSGATSGSGSISSAVPLMGTTDNTSSLQPSLVFNYMIKA